MKYTRIDISKNYKKDEISWIINYVIIIPILAIIIGSIVAKYVVVPNIKKNTNLESSQNIQVYSTDYMIQAGVYSNKDNADMVVKILNTINYKPITIESDDGYRVIIDTTYDLNNSEKIQENLKKSGYSCFVNKLSIDSNISKNNEEMKQINTYISNIIKLISLQIAIKDNGKCNDQIIGTINKYDKDINEDYNDIKKDNLKITDDICKFGDTFNSYKDEFNKNINCNSVETYNSSIAKEFIIIRKMIDLYGSN